MMSRTNITPPHFFKMLEVGKPRSCRERLATEELYLFASAHLEVRGNRNSRDRLARRRRGRTFLAGLDQLSEIAYTYRSVSMPEHKIPHPEEHAQGPGARDKLLCAAVELFTARGYAATSVREIVEHAGLTKPALYYHFGSKESIYLEILKGVHLMLGEALSRLSSGDGSTRERLIRFGVGLYELFEENVSAARFMNAVLWGPPQGAPPFDFHTFHEAVRAAVRRIVEEGIARGELRPADPAEIAQAFIAVISFSMDVHLVYPESKPGTAGLRRTLDILFRGIALPVDQETTR
jgi:TetR/AcrR family transcriptional regulator